ncbi:FAD-binding oxidoreductase [Candidatus Saccharibacteria bacterium]|nr:FAD-binding oxidoreductase [Candidatus Saccharibacteria bacterium]
MNKIAIYLNRHLTGNVFDKEQILDAYSTDRSLLKIKPRLVAIPENTADIRKIVRFVSQLAEKKYNLPIAVRGSGLSKTGSDLSSGIVISTEKLNHVKELDPHDRLAHVQAGITIGKLNAVLAPHGLTLPVAADPNETVGSLIANAPRDDYSKLYGGISNYVNRIEVVLSNGELIQTAPLSLSKLADRKRERSFEGEIYTKLDELLAKNEGVLEGLSSSERFGYPALKHVRSGNGRSFDLSPIFFGSEGNLGIITEAILRLEVLPPRPHRMLVSFPSIETAREFMSFAKKLQPLSINLYDARIFEQAEDSGKRPDILPKKLDKGYIVIVSFNDKLRKIRRKIKKCQSFLPKTTRTVAETLKNTTDFDVIKNSLILYLNDSTKGEHPNVLHDFYVPGNRLAEFTEQLQNLEKEHKKSFELYGCYTTGIYSLRPEFDLSKIEERRTAIMLMRDFNELLKEYDGAFAGGLPEGKLKSLILYPELEASEKKLFKDVKKIFDNSKVFAPETKTDYDTKSTVRHLRAEPNQNIES